MELRFTSRNPARICRAACLALSLVFLSCFQIACTCVNKNADPLVSAAIAQAKSDLKPLESPASAALTRDQRKYFQYYRIQMVREPKLGSFSSGDLLLAGQFHRPSRFDSGKGTVVVVHGYFDHAGTAANLINRLVEEGYHVAVYDHPGHGLSEGRHVSVRDFETYSVAFSDFLGMVSEHLPGPYDVVAHSMGSTVVIDHLNMGECSSIRKMVFLTPLIRDMKPKSLHTLGAIISPFSDYLGRIREDNTTNQEYLEFSARDPLQYACVSTRWSVAFNRWRREARDFGPRSEAPLVIYAGSDAVVNNEVGQAWMKRAFPSHRNRVIEGGRHQLLNDPLPIREKVLDLICRELDADE